MKVLPVADPCFEEDGRKYRVYPKEPADAVQERVKRFYYLQHSRQTVEFVRNMHEKYLKFDHANMTIMDCLDLLSNFLDESDPDVNVPNIFHAYQTAERLRVTVPHKPWMHLVGLIHDLGKVMSVWGEEQFAVTGDTYPVGCAPSEVIVYGPDSFTGNPDINDDRYNSKYGMYKPNCGLENVVMTWGHDEYMYQVLSNKGTTLPKEALYAIRFHSFYPYHSNRSYTYLCDETDQQMLPSVMELNACDLYSKSDNQPDIGALKPYYQSLADQYIPGAVDW